MMTFVLVSGEGERKLRADVWSLNGRQTIAGSWSNGEDDVMRFKFKYKILLTSLIWAPISFNGHFDPERDALIGIWGLSADRESSMGKMEFRRIPPCYLTVYPSIKELRDNKPRALWRFAVAAVRNDIRRDHWTWSYFSQRRDDRKTGISLLVRSRWFGQPLSAEETGTLHAIARRLMPDDACFYDSKVDHIRAYTCVHE
jgi:Vacuolar sorting-associated protein 13, N-terminal